MEQEVIALAARNSNLEHQVQELIELLEERDYEIDVLKAQIDCEGKQGTVDTNTLKSPIASEVATLTLGTFQSNDHNKEEKNKANNYNDNDNRSKNGHDDHISVRNATREYLHLTASAVKIKFHHVSTVTSEQLISNAKSLPFFQYHDYMVHLMEQEESKIKMKELKLSGVTLDRKSSLSPENSANPHRRGMSIVASCRRLTGL